ncbi:MAG: GAF domain-containing protein [Bacteroidota bacterium]
MPEFHRINTLHTYGVMDLPQEGVFDHYTYLASSMLGTPFAAVTLVDEDRIVFKSLQGVKGLSSLPRGNGFCNEVIKSEKEYIVSDTWKEPSYSGHPLVQTDLNVRSYAAWPISAHNGEKLGALCVFDNQPREFSEQDVFQLERLAKMVSAQVEAMYGQHRGKKAEENLTYMLKAVFENSTGSSGIFDRELRFMYFNEVGLEICEQIFGKTPQIGDSMLDFLLPEYLEEFKNYYDRALKGESIHVENEFQGTWWQFKIFPFYDIDGEIRGISQFVDDITARKQQELKVLQQNERLRHIAWQQSHEVRGPLADIMGLIEVMKNHPESSNIPYFDLLEAKANQLDGVVRNIINSTLGPGE